MATTSQDPGKNDKQPSNVTKPTASRYAQHSPTDPKFNPDPEDIATRLGMSLRGLTPQK